MKYRVQVKLPFGKDLWANCVGLEETHEEAMKRVISFGKQGKVGRTIPEED